MTYACWRAVCALFSLVALAACGTPSACAPGADGCPCDAAGACGDGLVCAEGSCTAPAEVALSVPAEARACEVLLLDGAGQVAGARFDGMTGAEVREAPRTALSFAANGDAPLGAVRVQVVGEGAFSIERSRCFDASGRELADGVRVGG